ncbi:unnamed protein product [Sphagnum tenellum]
MRIHSFRAGFATNSSSSHSVILLSPDIIGRVSTIDANEPNSFQWDHFRLVTEEDKLRYLAAQLFMNYGKSAEAMSDIVAKIEAEITGYSEEVREAVEAEMAGEYDANSPSVDHQSVLSLPDKYDPELVSAMIEFFKSPRVVVLGGNDNTYDQDEYPNAVPNATKVDFLAQIKDRGRGFRHRQDGQFWTIFDTENGNKVRFSFDENDLSADAYTKAALPELCDLKLTDYCTKNCQFCYMSSTEKGKHAPLTRIKKIAKMLGDMGVFEVALGGGEPTAHPDFAEILREFKQQGVMPNFTTFTDKWLDNEDIVKTVRETVGGIGVSCLDAKGLALVDRIKEGLRDKTQTYRGLTKVSAQHVVGSVPIMKTVDFIKAAFENHIPVLLLGFKEVGFGEKYSRFDDNSLETYIKLAIGNPEDNRWAQLSIDTALADRYPNLTKVLGVPDALVSSPEGKFSCYIDAVTNQCAASSYVKPHEMLPLPKTIKEFKNVFATFEVCDRCGCLFAYPKTKIAGVTPLLTNTNGYMRNFKMS